LDWKHLTSMKAFSLLLVLPGALAVNVVNPKNPDNNARASWGYTALNGPATWPGTYATCAGTSQSPINIVSSSAVAADPGSLVLGAYDSAMTGEITNNEHTITFTYTGGIQPYVTGGRLPAGDTFQFLQLHWHWGSASNQGSEHTVDGKEYPAEVHLVHWNTKYADVTEAVSKDDGLAVLGFFYEVSSADNGNLDAMLGVVNQVKNRQLQINAQNRRKNKGKRNNLSRAETNSATVPGSIRLDQLLPSTGLPDDYYYYKGSLTTPTCDEVVLWTVFPTTVPISEAQLNIFRTLKDSNSVTLNDNYRPPQALNGRTVYKRSVATTTTANKVVGDAGASLSGAIFGSLATFFAFAFLYPQLETQKRRRSNEFRSHEGFAHHTQPSQEAFFGENILKKIFGLKK